MFGFFTIGATIRKQKNIQCPLHAGFFSSYNIYPSISYCYSLDFCPVNLEDKEPWQLIVCIMGTKALLRAHLTNDDHPRKVLSAME